MALTSASHETVRQGLQSDGRTPMQTFRDTQHLAQQKRLETLVEQQQ